MTKWITGLAVAVAVVVLILCSRGCLAPAPADGLVLASIWEVTGQVAQYGEAAQRAVDMAVDEFNSKRGAGKPLVRLARQDTQSTSAGAASAFRGAMQQGPPIVILGPLTSPAAMTIAPLAEAERVVMMTTASTPDLTGAGPFVFRIYPSDSFEARALAEYLRAKTPKPGPFAIAFPQNDYGIGLDKAFVQAAAPDIDILVRFPYPADQAEFLSLAPRIVDSGARSLYLPGYPATVGPLVRTLRNQGFSGEIYSGLGIEDATLFALAGQATNGIIYTTTAIPSTEENPLRKRFEQGFRKRYGVDASFPALYGYDVAQVVLAAIDRGAKSSADLISQFAPGFSFTGVTGIFTFDENGDVRRAYQLKYVNFATRSFDALPQDGKTLVVGNPKAIE